MKKFGENRLVRSMNATRIEPTKEEFEKQKKELGSKERFDKMKTVVRTYKPKDRTKKTVKHSKQDLSKAHAHMKKHGG